MQRDFPKLTPIFSFSFHFLLLLTHGLVLLFNDVSGVVEEALCALLRYELEFV